MRNVNIFVHFTKNPNYLGLPLYFSCPYLHINLKDCKGVTVPIFLLIKKKKIKLLQFALLFRYYEVDRKNTLLEEILLENNKKGENTYGIKKATWMGCVF